MTVYSPSGWYCAPEIRETRTGITLCSSLNPRRYFDVLVLVPPFLAPATAPQTRARCVGQRERWLLWCSPNDIDHNLSVVFCLISVDRYFPACVVSWGAYWRLATSLTPYSFAQSRKLQCYPMTDVTHAYAHTKWIGGEWTAKSDVLGTWFASSPFALTILQNLGLSKHSLFQSMA